MSLRKLIKKAKTSKQIEICMRTDSQKFLTGSEKWIKVNDLKQWQKQALMQAKEVINRNWDEQSQFIPCKAPCARDIEYAFKNILYILSLSEDKDPIKVLHESIKKNDKILKGLNTGSKKVKS
jgi:hypothetical protein